MRAIAEMVEFFAEEGILRHDVIRALREEGFWNVSDEDDYNHLGNGYYEYDVGCADDYGSYTGTDVYEDVQSSLERLQRPASPTWVGKARKRWWKGYQVGKVARARRAAQRERGR